MAKGKAPPQRGRGCASRGSQQRAPGSRGRRRPPPAGRAPAPWRRRGAGPMAAALRLGRAARLLPAAASPASASALRPPPRLGSFFSSSSFSSSSSLRRRQPPAAMQAFQYPEVYRDETAVSTRPPGASLGRGEPPRARGAAAGPGAGEGPGGSRLLFSLLLLVWGRQGRAQGVPGKPGLPRRGAGLRGDINLSPLVAAVAGCTRGLPCCLG